MTHRILGSISTWWGAGLLFLGSGGVTLLSFFPKLPH